MSNNSNNKKRKVVSHYIVPVHDHTTKKSTNAKFVMPKELMYPNMMSLLGITLNPWNAEDDSDKDDASETSTVIEELDTHIFRELLITSDHCVAYVAFRKFKAISHKNSLLDFLCKAAAPDEMILQSSKILFQQELTDFMSRFTRVDYEEKDDESSGIKYFKEFNYSRNKSIKFADKCAQLYTQKEDIDALRDRIMHHFASVSPFREQQQVLREVFCEYLLPHYNVVLGNPS